MNRSRISFIWLLVFGFTLPVSVIISTNLARRSFEKVKFRTQTISVKGYAERDIVSDRASWSASIVQRAPAVDAAYAALEANRTVLVKYLNDGGFATADIELSPVNVEEVYKKDEKGNRTNTLDYYSLTQTASINSSDVQKLAKVAREASSLLGKGIELDCSPPEYIYTQLNQLKLQMLGDASDNARDRAKQLVEHGGGHLGPMRSASQGVFQITPQFSTEVSGSGENDTANINKVIKAVVTQEYAID